MFLFVDDEQKRMDLKKIRTELKVPSDASSATAGALAKAASPAPSTSSANFVPSSPSGHHAHDVPLVQRGSRGSDDDIYEFREPEPFEFEVRGRRESPFNEDRVHHQRFPQQQQQTQRKPAKEDDEEKETTPKKSGTPTSSVNFIYLKIIKLRRQYMCYV